MSSADFRPAAITAGSASAPPATLARQALAEFVGTAALLCVIIGSGIMAERLAGGNVAIALLANTLATVFALYVLIETLGPVSGAHFNPLVTLVFAFDSTSNSPPAPATRRQVALVFIACQLLGAVLGAWLANAMFDLPVLQASTKLRGGWTAAGQFSGWGQWLAEVVATAALLFVVLRAPPAKAGALVACTIGAAYWFTASTSFANPAVVLGRMFSDSFTGIAPASAPGFVLAQAVGALAGWRLARTFDPPRH